MIRIEINSDSAFLKECKRRKIIDDNRIYMPNAEIDAQIGDTITVYYMELDCPSMDKLKTYLKNSGKKLTFKVHGIRHNVHGKIYECFLLSTSY